MGSTCSCNRSLASRGDTTLLNSTQSQGRPDHAETVVDLNELPANVIRVAVKTSVSNNLNADNAGSITDFYGDGILTSLADDQFAQSNEKLINRHLDLVPSSACSQQNSNESTTGPQPKSELKTQKSAEGGVEFSLSDSYPQNATTDRGRTEGVIITEETAETVLEAENTASPSPNIHTGNPPHPLKIGENSRNGLSLRSHSFDSIETLSLEFEEVSGTPEAAGTGKNVCADLLGSDINIGNVEPHQPLRCTLEHTDNESDVRGEFCTKGQNIEISTPVTYPDPLTSGNCDERNVYPQRTGSDETPRALVNLLHSLYHGKRSKYRGWSEFRGKARTQTRALRSRPRRHGSDLNVTTGRHDTWFNPHGLGSSSRDNLSRSTQPSMVFRLDDEGGRAVNTDIKSITPVCSTIPGKEHNSTPGSPDENCQVNAGLEACMDTLWMTEANAPLQRFPFNIYKGRNQNASKTSFPLADFRFDDDAYVNKATSPKDKNRTHNYRYEQNAIKHENNDKSLASALSIAGRLVKGFSISETTLPKAHPTHFGLNFKADASLNDVFLNVNSSSGLRKEAQHVTKTVAMQQTNLPAQAKMATGTSVKEHIKIDSKTTNESNRQKKRLASLEEMFRPPQSSNQTLRHVKLLDGPFLIGCLKETHNIGTRMRSGIYSSLVMGKLLSVPPLCELPFELPMEQPPHRLLTPVSQLSTMVDLCSSSPVLTYWRGANKDKEKQSSQSNCCRKQMFHLSPVLSDEIENCARATCTPDTMQTKRFNSCLENSLCLKMPDQTKCLPVLSEATGLGRTRTTSMNMSTRGHTLLAGQSNMHSCSCRLVYSRHMNK